MTSLSDSMMPSEDLMPCWVCAVFYDEVEAPVKHRKFVLADFGNLMAHGARAVPLQSFSELWLWLFAGHPRSGSDGFTEPGVWI